MINFSDFLGKCGYSFDNHLNGTTYANGVQESTQYMWLNDNGDESLLIYNNERGIYANDFFSFSSAETEKKYPTTAKRIKQLYKFWQLYNIADRFTCDDANSNELKVAVKAAIEEA